MTLFQTRARGQRRESEDDERKHAEPNQIRNDNTPDVACEKFSLQGRDIVSGGDAIADQAQCERHTVNFEYEVRKIESR